MATTTAFTIPELEGNPDKRMAREWHSLSGKISERLFPEEHAAAQRAKNP